MILTQSAFKEKLENQTLRLCFVGMSNIGKSHLSRLLKKEFNFTTYEVDDQIQQSMRLKDIGSSANWMGHPYEDRYPENVKTYLKLESENTLAAPIETDKNLVLDTTGSVINLEPTVHQWLRAHFLVINFDCPKSMLNEMSRNYFKHPKPVVWGESFSQKPQEDGLEALKRCYPQLLEDRTKRYRQISDITIPGEVTRSRGVSAKRVIDLMALNLPST